MKKRTKYILTALVVAVVVSNVMLTSKARVPPTSNVRILGQDFYENLPQDLADLHVKLQREADIYEAMMKEYDPRLLAMDEGRLASEESAKLLE